MSLMGGLYVGASGLQTSSNALNTTAHNLSNVDTVGYTRQQVLQSNKRYNRVGNAYIGIQQSGLGVDYAKVRQVRDSFLDKSYRKEAGRASFYSTGYEVVEEVETLFGEMEGTQFQAAMTGLWNAVQELNMRPSDATCQGLLVSKAASFLERAQAVYSGLSSYQDNLNEQVKDMIDTINTYGDTIYELNQKIVAIEAGGIEEANDYRDARNQLLDELGSMVKISYDEDIYGAVTVQIEGHNFVTKNYVNKMGTTEDVYTGFYTPVWPLDQNNTVYNLTQKISTDLDTDIGSLKSLLLARGDRRGDYTDIPVKPVREDFASDADYRAALTQYSTDVDIYNRDVEGSILVNTMAEFDQLIHDMVVSINEVLNPRTESGGTTSVAGFDLFLRKGVDDVTVAEDASDTYTLYSTANLKMNSQLLQQYTLLGATMKPDGTYTNGFMTVDNQENKAMADALSALFNKEFAALNPNISTKLTYKEYYTNLIGQVANEGEVYKGIAQNQMSAATTIDAQRQQIIGVSDSEELTNMIKFQNAYNASSRYINVVNEMLGHIIERLG